MKGEFKKTGYDLKPHSCGVTAPPVALVVMTMIALAMVAAVMRFARPGAIDGVVLCFLAVFSLGCVLSALFFIWRWYRAPRYRLSLIGGSLEEGTVVRVQFEQIGQTLIDRLVISVIGYNPAAISPHVKRHRVAEDFEREYCRKFSSTVLRRFDVAPVPAQGLFELTVPSVKDDGRAWGINFEFVVGGETRQEFFAPPRAACL